MVIRKHLQCLLSTSLIFGLKKIHLFLKFAINLGNSYKLRAPLFHFLDRVLLQFQITYARNNTGHRLYHISFCSSIQQNVTLYM